MKNPILVIIVFYFAIHKIHGQNLTIVYEASILSVPEIAQNALPELSERKIKYCYSLTINKGISKFSRDSIFIESFPATKMNEIWCFEEIYKNYNQDLWIKHSGRYKEGYGLEKKITQMVENNNFQWEISQDKQVIAGVECTKAISPKGYTAWFAPKLPYPDGPRYGVFNLPGLVLLLETAQERWLAKKIIMHNKLIQIPDIKLVNGQEGINLSYTDLKGLNDSKVIIIDKNTPKKQWLTFKSSTKE
jgi:GLPGLI family protein